MDDFPIVIVVLIALFGLFIGAVAASSNMDKYAYRAMTCVQVQMQASSTDPLGFCAEVMNIDSPND